MIVGDSADPEIWNKMLASVDGVADNIYISYNGKEKEFPYTKTNNMVVEHHAWTDDFSEARNHSFGMVDKEIHQWIFWLDSDDELINSDKVRPMLDRADKNGIGQIFCSYIYASDPVDGTPRVTQWRERFLSTKLPWKWFFSIHEVCHTRPGSKVVNYNDCFVLHHREIDPFTHEATRTRNRRILAEARKHAPNEPRYIYYQANELFAEAYFLFEQKDPQCGLYFQEAIKAYRDFGQTNPSSDDAYIANYRIGDALRMMGQWPRAIDVAMQGIKIRPRWPDSWVLASHNMLGMKEYEACDEFASICLEICEAPMTNQISEPLTLNYTPYALRALARTELGHYEEALEDYDTALKYWYNEKLAERRDEMVKRWKNVNVKNAKNAREKTFGMKPTRSIAFLTRPLPEVWNALTLKEGSGGAEWAVHEIARRFKSDGFRVCIFGTPGEERGVDTEGIEWWNTEDFDSNEEFTYIVSVRAPEIFDTPLKARKEKILWLHDINMGGMEVALSPWGNRFDNPDHIIALTEFHNKRIQRTYMTNPAKMTVIGNGINLEDYPEWGDRQKNKFIYASSPDRGIDTLMQMWPKIKNQINDAELHIYYGWAMLDRIVAMSNGTHPLMDYKNRVVELYESVKHLDVTWHDRVSRSELQTVETTCDKLLYPTHFLETFCITAIECQMNGVLPLVNPIGALPEVIPNTAYHVAGMPNHPDYHKKYIDRLVELQNNPMDAGDREMHREFASRLTWDHRYDQWRAMMGFNPTKGKRLVTSEVS